MRQAVILAAGRGARMMPLTNEVPKAMAPFKGATLLKHGLDSVLREVPLVHVTVGYHKAMLAGHAIEHGAASVLNTEGHGNCWWIFNTFFRLLDEPVLVLTCDTVGELDVDMIAREYERLGEPACMLVPICPVEGVEGDYIAHDDGVVARIGRAERTNVYASGIQVLNPARVIDVVPAHIEDFHDLWQVLITHRQLKASAVYPRRWRAFDTLQQLLAAERSDL